MQWYDFIDAMKLKVDAIDKNSKCIRLRWQRTPAEHDSPTAGSDFGLISVEIIWRIFHPVARALFCPKLGTVLRERKIETIFVERVLDGKVRVLT